MKGAQFYKFIDPNLIVFHFHNLLCFFGGRACVSSGIPSRARVSATVTVKFGPPFF